MDDIITLDYGSGGKKTSNLIENMLLPLYGNEALNELGDGAVVDGGEKLVFSTDSFVVDPIFFPGGDIGRLSVCGTVNDVSVSGGEIKYLSCAFIIEEGFSAADLKKIAQSVADECRITGVKVVTGDTKVVERGRGDKIYINTAGIGILKYPGLSPKNIRPGDAVLVSGTVGDHGTAVMLSRNGMMQGELKSDCAPLNTLCKAVLEACPGTRVLRDPTRGGVATTLNEFTEGSPFSIELDEKLIPVKDSVRAACDMLGLDPLYCANEGKLLAVVPAGEAEAALEAMRSLEVGRDAAIIGYVSEGHPGKVIMKTSFGGGRILQKLAGAQLPRIC